MFLMIVQSCISLCILDMDVDVPHDRSVMFSSGCSRYGRLVFLMIVLSCFRLCVLDVDFNVHHVRPVTFSYM